MSAPVIEKCRIRLEQPVLQQGLNRLRQLVTRQRRLVTFYHHFLYLHRSLLDELPPVLRAYVGCATALFGDVSQADVIKLHKTSGKATFMVYDDFEGKPLPELRQRIKVNLRTRWVQVFDHSAERQLLYFKERFVSANHPGRATMENFSAKVRKLGFDEATIGRGPLRAELDALLAAKGLNENLNPRRRTPRPIASDENGRDSDEATV